MLQVISLSRASLTGSSAEPNGASQGPIYAATGKLAFWSSATNLVSGDTNARVDIFLKDIASGAVTRLSTSSGGVQANGNSYSPSFSSDGNLMAFHSDATALVGSDTNNTNDIFVKNLTSGIVTRISTDSSGTQGNGSSTDASISADGNLVAFRSYATNLVAGDTNGQRDIFIKNITTGVTTRISQDAGGVEANAGSDAPVISKDGSKVAFWSLASNLAGGDTNNTYDVFIKDVVTGAVTIASQDAGGTIGNLGSYDPVFSPDGTKIAFRTFSTNLFLGDTNGSSDILVKDLTTGLITLVSCKADGFTFGNADSFSPVFSPDGTKIAFASRASNLVSDDTNGVMDIFVKDLITNEIIRVSKTPEGTQAFRDCFSPTWSPDGQSISFYTLSSNLVTGDSNNAFDIYVMGLAGQQTITGGDEDETHTGGAANDSIDGGAGNDSILGGGGDDSLYGGEGNDTIDGEAGQDIVDGGPGDDVLYGGDGVNWILGGDGNDSLIGSSGVDSMEGNAGNDTLQGNAGDDTLDGGADNDSLSGGAGFDSLLGGDGNDYLNGEADSDYMDGGAGEDTLYGGDGSEIMTGGADNDLLYGDAGNDRVVGDLGNDTLYGDAGSDSLIGGDGNDSLSGGTENDYFDGGNDNDTIDGGMGNDSMLGGDGIDTLNFATATTGIAVNLAVGSVTSTVYGNDTISGFEIVLGGIGDDSFIFSSAAETLNGGAGTDTADYSASSSAVTVKLWEGTAIGGYAAGDVLLSIENLTGSAYNDRLEGTGIANLISGGDGSDNLNGASGNDTLLGGAGGDLLRGHNDADVLTGGAGADIFIYYTLTESTTIAPDRITDFENGSDRIQFYNLGFTSLADFTVTLDSSSGEDRTYVTANGGSGFSFYLLGDHVAELDYSDFIFYNAGAYSVIGTSGNDNLVGTSASEALQGLEGNDTLSGGAGTDTLDGGDGNDTADYSYSSGSWTFNLVTGLTSADGGETLISIENLIGAQGNDTLIGNAQANLLNGHLGNNTLVGGAGADTLIGGSGTDTADYSTSSSAVTVKLWENSGAGGDATGDSFNSIENLTGSAYNDRLEGTGVANLISGGGGNDNLNGASGNDTLIGGDGNDMLRGHNDADTLTGGAGVDVFIYYTLTESTTTATDRITDFTNGTDRIQFYALGFTSLADFTITLDASSGEDRTYVTANNASGFSFYLLGNHTADLDNTDFIF